MGGETASGRDAGSTCPSTVEQSKKRRLNFVKALMIGQLLSLAMATTGLTSGYLATKQGVSIPNTQSLLNYLLLAAVWGTIVQLQTRPGWPSLLLWRSSQSRRSAGVDATVATGDGTVGKLEEGIVNAARCGTLLPLRHEPASTNGNRGDTSRLAWARDEREEGRRPASHVRHDLRNGHHAAGDGEHETRHSASRYRAATTFDASPVPEEAEGEEEGEEEVLQVRLGVSNGLSKEREGEWMGSLTTEAESGNTRGGRSWTWRGGRLMVFPLLGLFDVEANFIIVMAYRFTSVTSVSLLDCFTIPLVMLGSTVFLHAQYRRHHVLGCLICVAGLATILLTDHWSRGDSASSAPLLGDAMVLLAATLYSVGNVTQEKLLGSCVPTSFLLAQLGMWGSLFCSIQVFTLERHRLAEVELGSVPVWGPMVGFSVALFSFSSLVPYVLSNAGSAALNLSLLTSDLWVTMFRILFFGGFTTLELVGFAASLLQVTGGLVLFSIGGDPYSCQHRAADAAPQATAGGAGRPATAGEGDEVPLIGPADSWPSHISHIELSSPVVSTQASEQALVMDHAESPLPGSWSDSPRAMLCPDVNRQPRPI